MKDLDAKQAEMKERQRRQKKRCNRCKVSKPLKDFGTSNGKPRSLCKKCDAITAAESRARFKAERKAYWAQKATESAAGGSAAITVETPPRAKPAPASTPVEAAPAPCPCPKRKIDGVLFKAHRPDCAALGLFTDRWPQKGDAITGHSMNWGTTKPHSAAA